MKKRKWGKEVIWVDYIEGEKEVQEMGAWLEKHSGIDCEIMQNLKLIRNEVKKAETLNFPESDLLTSDIYFKKLQNRIMKEVDRQVEQPIMKRKKLYRNVLRQFPLYRFGR